MYESKRKCYGNIQKEFFMYSTRQLCTPAYFTPKKRKKTNNANRIPHFCICAKWTSRYTTRFTVQQQQLCISFYLVNCCCFDKCEVCTESAKSEWFNLHKPNQILLLSIEFRGQYVARCFTVNYNQQYENEVRAFQAVHCIF